MTPLGGRTGPFGEGWWLFMVKRVLTKNPLWH
jgi:hypothetical protein